jgi:membrane AbrB-like protein
MQVLTGLAVGLAGGLLFALLHLPAAWLAGSMIAGVIAVYAGISIHVPPWQRSAAFILLGVQTGASVTWETFERVWRWPLSIATLAVTVVVVTWAGHMFYRHARAWDTPTAFFGSLPGALSLTLALADEAKADMRRVTISQCVRLFFLVAALPALIEFLAPERTIAVVTAQYDWTWMVIAIGLATAGGLALEKLRVPAGLILGAIVATAALSLAGGLSGPTPDVVLIPANIILGVMIAERFRSFSFAELKTAFAESLGGFVIALAISIMGAVAASWIASLPFALTLLAFAPGGLEAMTIMAFALDLDPAYVAAHQVARYIGICLFLPPIAAWMVRTRAKAAQPEDG